MNNQSTNNCYDKWDHIFKNIRSPVDNEHEHVRNHEYNQRSYSNNEHTRDNEFSRDHDYIQHDRNHKYCQYNGNNKHARNNTHSQHTSDHSNLYENNIHCKNYNNRRDKNIKKFSSYSSQTGSYDSIEVHADGSRFELHTSYKQIYSDSPMESNNLNQYGDVNDRSNINVNINSDSSSNRIANICHK